MGKRHKQRKRPKSYVVVPERGPPCPRCGWHMQMREHRSIEDKHLLQPYYYRRWYCCMQRRCRTTLVMPEEHKVWNEAMLAQPEPVEPASVLRPGDDIALDMLSADDKKAPWE